MYLKNLNKTDQIHSFFSNKDGSNAVQELFSFDDYIITLTTHGVCFAYEKCINPLLINLDGGEIQILNTNEKEKIRSIFLNTLNDSIFIVSVREKQDCSKMKCRSLPIK